MSNKKNYDQALARAKDLYENTDISIATIARLSIELLGQEIPLNTLRSYASEQGWTKNTVDADDIRSINQIEEIINNYLAPENRRSLTVREVSDLVLSMDRLQRMKARYRAHTTGANETQKPIGRTQLLNRES